ncbi:hypothetical protein PS1_040623 [Malus domestica]
MIGKFQKKAQRAYNQWRILGLKPQRNSRLHAQIQDQGNLQASCPDSGPGSLTWAPLPYDATSKPCRLRSE